MEGILLRVASIIDPSIEYDFLVQNISRKVVFDFTQFRGVSGIFDLLCKAEANCTRLVKPVATEGGVLSLVG